MKKVVIILAVIFAFVNSTFAQDGPEKSKTKSELSDAQLEVYQEVFDSLYNVDDVIDLNAVYKRKISIKTSDCLVADLELWGRKVLDDIEQGKFKRYRLSFEKPEDAVFKVPPKAKRKYKRAFKKARKDFLVKRKRMTLKEIEDNTYISKHLRKVNKAFERQKNKYLRKLAK